MDLLKWTMFIYVFFGIFQDLMTDKYAAFPDLKPVSSKPSTDEQGQPTEEGGGKT